MTTQMKEALEKRGIIWGDRNIDAFVQLKKELRNPQLSFTRWFELRGLQFMGTGYRVRILPQP